MIIIQYTKATELTGSQIPVETGIPGPMTKLNISRFYGML